MAVSISISGGKMMVKDTTTGVALDWIEEITITRDPSGQPFIFFGTHAIELTATIGPVTTPTPTPTPTPTGGIGGP